MVLVSLRVFSLKKSTAGVFAVPFRVLTKKKNMTEECVMQESVSHAVPLKLDLGIS